MSNKIKLAIVEDHQSMIDGIQLLLNNEERIEIIGHFHNGLELINFTKTNQGTLIDVILTDIKMPELNGIEMTRQIKKEYPHIEVLAFSMLSKERVVFEMLAAGISGYLLKNAPLDLIVKAIHQVYNGNQFFDDSLSETISKYKKQSKRQEVKLESTLTNSEKQILDLIAVGKMTSEIAEIRFTAISTVEKHRKNMIKKLNLSGKNDLLRYALERKFDEL